MTDDTSNDEQHAPDRDRGPAIEFRPDRIRPYDEYVRLVLDVDGDPYESGDERSQLIERLQAASGRPGMLFEHGDDVWIQRTPDIEEPLIVSGDRGARSFVLMTATAEFEWLDGKWFETTGPVGD